MRLGSAISRKGGWTLNLRLGGEFYSSRSDIGCCSVSEALVNKCLLYKKVLPRSEIFSKADDN